MPDEAKWFEKQDEHKAQVALHSMWVSTLTTLLNLDYMLSQRELAWLMVNIINYFLSSRVVSLTKLQLVGIMCFFISKLALHASLSPPRPSPRYCSLAKHYMLKIIKWNLSFSNPMHFLQHISKADDYDIKARTISKYLLEVGALEWWLLATPSSLMATASIWLAWLIPSNDKWKVCQKLLLEGKHLGT
ncbi:hypothetical protein HD554DRAFT_2037127 [Boletus coccyginus]|nr:hypothetical protein HD554DRAFT_2037127 [Boletus coccyginus]